MADDKKEEEIQEEEEEEEIQEEKEEEDAGPAEKDGDDKEEDEAGSGGGGKAEGEEGAGVEEKDEDEGLSKEEKKKRDEEGKAKKKEEAAEAKKKEKEEKEAKAKADKEAKENKAKEEKERKFQEKEAKKEEAKRKKEEKAKKASAQHGFWTKGTWKTITIVMVSIVLVMSLGSVGIGGYWIDSVAVADRQFSKAVAEYCTLMKRNPSCVSIPSITIFPYYAFIAWASSLALSSVATLIGATQDGTASIDCFALSSLVLGCVQIAFSAVSITMSDDVSGQCGVKPSWCPLLPRNDSMPYNATIADNCECSQPGLAGSFRFAAETIFPILTLMSVLAGLAGSFRFAVETIWVPGSSPSDGQALAEPAWQGTLGCGGHASAREQSGCLAGAYARSTLIMACLMCCSLVFQAVGVFSGNRLKAWIVQERGRDLFPQARMSIRFRSVLLPSFVFLMLFGIVIASIAPSTL